MIANGIGPLRSSSCEGPAIPAGIYGYAGDILDGMTYSLWPGGDEEGQLPYEIDVPGGRIDDLLRTFGDDTVDALVKAVTDAGREFVVSVYEPQVVPGGFPRAALTGAAGACLAPGRVPTARLLLSLVGTALIVGSANALNMWWDSDIDALMARTRLRAVPSGLIAPGEALYFASEGRDLVTSALESVERPPRDVVSAYPGAKKA